MHDLQLLVQLDREAAEKKRKQEAKDRPPEPQEGGLGLSRKFDLNRQARPAWM